MSAIPSKQYHKIKERHPQFMAALEELGKVAKQEGPIDEKTAQLIQLAAATANRSEGAVHSHTRRALEAGASAEEIYQTILLLIQICPTHRHMSIGIVLIQAHCLLSVIDSMLKRFMP